MDIVIIVDQAQPSMETGQVDVSAAVATTAGHDLRSDVTVDFVASAQQTNAVIIAAAKQALATQLGLVLDGSERVLLFGGRS